DGLRAHRALWALAAVPGQAVPLLRERLQPLQPAHVARLTADLDSRQFNVRDKATRELEVLGKAVEPALRKALAGAKSLELRRRLEQLLEKSSKQLLSQQQVRMLRGIEALEAMGTPEARQVLEGLARGVPESLEQTEAQASLRRLARSRP